MWFTYNMHMLAHALYLGVTHKYKNQKKSEISDLGGEGGGEGVRRAENFWLFFKKI